MPKQCRDLCRNEEMKHCHFKLYEDGYRQCITCIVCYKPDKSQSQSHCYCCGSMLRSRPQNKRNYKHHLVWID